MFWSHVAGLYPPDSQRNDTQTLTDGDTNVKVSCSVEFGTILPHIAVCYAPSGESFVELNVSENCLFCDLQQYDQYCNSANDGRIHSRPDWNVRVSIQNEQSCISRHTTELEIPKVSMEDNDGIVYCTWGHLLTKMHVYEQYTLLVEEPPPTWIELNWKYMALGGGLFVSFVLVVVALLTIGLMHSWRKAKRAEFNRKRRLERRKTRHSNSPSLPMPAGQTGEYLKMHTIVATSNNSETEKFLV